MKSFFKYLLATILGVIIASIIVFFIFIGMITALITSSKDETIKVKPNSILELKFDKEIVDRASNNPLDNFNFQSFESEPKLGLDAILKNIEKAKKDENIKGIFLNTEAIPAGFAAVEEIRNALIDFKTSGKFILSYSEYYTQKSYYLASVSDKIYANPEGEVDFKGLQAEGLFFKGTLDKLGIEPIILRHGKFKSAVEPFMLDKMSDANREQTQAFLSSLWNRMVEGISQSRNIPVAELNQIADNLLITDPQAAITYKLIDSVKYFDQITEELKTLSNQPKDLILVSIGKYSKSPQIKEEKRLAKDKIAVIFAQGGISSGKGDEMNIGSERISQAIRDARTDTTIKAIVLRVNSPGGSALASDVIWREMVLARKVKPVIASMGDVAASGGYYISCAADTIVASPTTITGSIGVFGLMLNAEKFMKDKLGITSDRVVTNKNSNIGSALRPMSAEEREILQKQVEKVYETFVSHVAEGRHMTKSGVDSIGQGRVWSGATAQKIGLVDVLGGLNTAIGIAAEKAHLTKYRIVSMPKQEDPFDMLLKSISEDTKTAFIREELGDSFKYYQQINQMIKTKGVQARMPYILDIY